MGREKVTVTTTDGKQTTVTTSGPDESREWENLAFSSPVVTSVTVTTEDK